MGHALNKALKDFIIRSYAMRGYYTPYIPGWDNHGMPIESAIIKEQKLNHKAMSIADFRSACHDYAQKYIDRQMAGFKRMGVMGDWEHPYKTMNKGFESDEVRVFGKMYQNGHIYKGLKPVYWCAHDETALAEAEIEYQDDPCTTVFVKFPMHDDLGKLPNVDHSKLFFVIWTTTIWTSPPIPTSMKKTKKRKRRPPRTRPLRKSPTKTLIWTSVWTTIWMISTWIWATIWQAWIWTMPTTPPTITNNPYCHKPKGSAAFCLN